MLLPVSADQPRPHRPLCLYVRVCPRPSCPTGPLSFPATATLITSVEGPRILALQAEVPREAWWAARYRQGHAYTTAGAESVPRNTAPVTAVPNLSAPVSCCCPTDTQTAAWATEPPFPAHQSRCLGKQSPGETECPQFSTPRASAGKTQGLEHRIRHTGRKLKLQAREAAASEGLEPSRSLCTHWPGAWAGTAGGLGSAGTVNHAWDFCR